MQLDNSSVLQTNCLLLINLLTNAPVLKKLYCEASTFLPLNGAHSEKFTDIGSFLGLSVTSFRDIKTVENQLGNGPFYQKNVLRAQDIMANKLEFVNATMAQLIWILIKDEVSKPMMLKWICSTLNFNKEKLKMQPNPIVCSSDGKIIKQAS